MAAKEIGKANKKTWLNKEEKEAFAEFIQKEFPADQLTYSKIKTNTDLFYKIKQHILNDYLKKLEAKIIKAHKEIKDKIKDSSYLFNSKDGKIITKFIGNIGGRGFFNNFDRMNSLNTDGFNDTRTSWDLLNIIKKADSIRDSGFQDWIKKSPDSKKRARYEYLFSIVKFIQDPNKYPLIYTRWQFIREWVLGEDKDKIDYEGLCAFYRGIIQDTNYPDYPDLEMQTYMECVCGKIFQRIDELNDTKLKEIAKIGLKKAERDIDTLTQIFDNNYQPNNGTEEESKDDCNLNGDDDGEHDLPLNLILYGPPGTGKTYHTVDKALERILSPAELADLVKDKNTEEERREAQEKKFNELKTEGRIEFTTFHQSMSYEDFIEGIKPIYNKDKKILEYPSVPGIFKKLCETAGPLPQQPYVLIIDEINRGNVVNIFGELITLIEKDKRKISGRDSIYSTILPYSNKTFSVPSNLYIIGTMNTADRSVEALDTALRRRFSFEEIKPDPDSLGDVIIPGAIVSLAQILRSINDRIEVLKDRDHLIGHSYFLKVKTGKDLRRVFFDKIIPLLQEFFYGDYEKIQMVLGDGFVKTVASDDILFANGKPYEDAPKLIYRIQDNSDSFDLLEALNKMNIPSGIRYAMDGNIGESAQADQVEKSLEV